jgi:hypothetical protein
MVSKDENIVNFARFRKISRDDRKRREKLEKETQAAANRVKFGRTGQEKKLGRVERDRQTRELEGKRREPSPQSPGAPSGNDNLPGGGKDR